ncbi:MAG: hypothetical protein KDC67_13365 [Ignavibacteriae bacterium]|nr:hypothetical protein [Ignavibacteriota bacterium]
MTTIGDIANEYAIRKGETDRSKQLRYILLGRDAVRELKLTATNEPVSVILDIDADSLSCKLPDDYLSWYAVGVACGNRVINLDYDRTLNISTPQIETFCDDSDEESIARFQSDCSCMFDGSFPDYYTGIRDYDNVISNGQFVGRMYGVNGNYKKIGFFKIDGKGRIIHFNSLISSQLKAVLTYRSTGIDNYATNYVSDDVKPAIVAYMRYHDLMDSGKNAAAAYEEYKRQYRTYKNTQYKVPLNKIMKAFQENSFQGKIRR